MEILDITDEDDNVIGQCGKHEAHDKFLLHRSAHVLVIRSDGRLLVQHRSRHARTYPLHLVFSAAGHVDTGETYFQAAQRELKEELGIEAPLTFIKKYRWQGLPMENEWVELYLCYHDGPYKVCEETESLMYFTFEELDKLTVSQPGLFHEGFVADIGYCKDFLRAA